MVAEDTEGLDERDMTSFLIEVRDLSQYGSVILTVDVIQQATIKPPNIITHKNNKIVVHFMRNPNWHIFYYSTCMYTN